MEYKISVHCQNFIAMNKSKSSEPMKKVKWLTPSQISEQILDSNSYESWSDTVTMDKEKGYEEAGTEPLLQGKWACTQSLYKECSSAEVTHTQCLWRWTEWAPWQTSQQPATLCWTLSCCPPNSVVHIYKGGSRRKVSSTLLSLFLLYFVEIMTLLMETYRGTSSVATLILNFSIKWRQLHNVIPWPLYPQGRTAVPTEWEAGWALNLVWMFFEKRRCLAPTGIQTACHLGCSLASILTNELGASYMAIKTSYVAMGYKKCSFFGGTKSIPPSQAQTFFQLSHRRAEDHSSCNITQAAKLWQETKHKVG